MMIIKISYFLLSAVIPYALSCFPKDDPRSKIEIPKDVNDVRVVRQGNTGFEGGGNFAQNVDGLNRPRWAYVDNTTVPVPPRLGIDTRIDEEDAILDVIGDGVSTYEYDPAGYNSAAGGPIKRPEQLTCDFDSGACCWVNAEVPLDHLQWQLATGIPEWGKMRDHFGPFSTIKYPLDKSPPMPNGRYLVVATKDGSPADEAQFVSCSIPCSLDKIRVTARHWTTPGILLQVCTRSSFFNDIKSAPLLNCKTLPQSRSPGTTTVILNKASLTDIVFVASNFVNSDGDAAIIDDIVVEYLPCAEPEEDPREQFGRDFLSIDNNAPVLKESEVELPTPTEITSRDSKRVKKEDILACQDVTCDFEEDTCDYKLTASRVYTNVFEHKTGTAWNRVSGVPRAGNGNGYVATYLKSKQTAAVSLRTSIVSDLDVTFRYYVSATGITFKVCCNGGDVCQYESSGHIDGDAFRHWTTAALMCPAGTTKIHFICENHEDNQGACALDDVKLHSPLQFDLC